MRTDDLDFHLPPELIAQVPLGDRSASRLLHYRRGDRSVAHRHFSDLPGLLRPGDVLVFNDARVIPARFTLRKSTGGLVDGLFVGQTPDGCWTAMLKNLGRAEELWFADLPQVHVKIVGELGGGMCRLRVESDEQAHHLLERIGRMPLPPYIRRAREHDPQDDLDRQRYQTVYASVPGAIAAPTAGLHFSNELLRQLDEAGVQRVFVTLHVGIGTFKPVEVDRLEDHDMHAETYTISPAAAEALNQAKKNNRRIIAVGTTSARVLESQPQDQPFEAKSTQTRLFIFPPYRWKHVDALITNFHLPRSTLIALVAAMVGLDEQRRLYQIAIEQRYRFFSYGDAMLIE